MPFQPGNTLGGKRKDRPWAEAVRKAAYAIQEDDPDKRRRLEMLADALVLKAQSGDVSALKEVGDRIDGKVPQAVIGGDEDDAPIQVALVELVAVKPEDDQTRLAYRVEGESMDHFLARAKEIEGGK